MTKPKGIGFYLRQVYVWGRVNINAPEIFVYWAVSALQGVLGVIGWAFVKLTETFKYVFFLHKPFYLIASVIAFIEIEYIIPFRHRLYKSYLDKSIKLAKRKIKDCKQ